MNIYAVASFVIPCAVFCVLAIVIASTLEYYRMVKKGWKREDEDPWDDDLE